MPWQSTLDPYLRWIAEIMLQQTQVEAVKPYYQRFSKKFPTVKSFAEASEDKVLVEWEGLGYYSRARNAHKCAKTVVKDYGGKFPLQVSELVK
ncbi:MAG: A/G-specific adenine glycosylase, partial [Burkholderiales bacterium]|nr:A/G-specific adenine glycosylase [Burkholderiales bacterium]